MTEPVLTADDFSEFFTAVHGHTPHLWQLDLARLVLEQQRWPDLLDLPTGVGKTAAVDIAVFALAAQPRSAPRRIIFVVDRRLIVDQVSERATTLAAALAAAPDDGSVLGGVAGRLRALSHGDTPLGVSALRGGARDDSWARRPDTPWVMVSTVDQVGSRLLFRGYGVSSRMRPVHAGLVGNDALILLDEVHISQAFAQTLAEIATHHRPPDPFNRWQVVEMSATPTGRDATPFRLTPADTDPERSPMLHRVVTATKPATLLTVGGRRDLPETAIPDSIVDAVADLPPVDSVAVVVNRVATALAVAERLDDAGYAPLLLTGRMRPHDRKQLLADPRFDRCRAGAAQEPGTGDAAPDGDDKPVVLVSTQSIEVGADLDFGAMITECAPIDSLRQRFGRVDRRGRRAADGHPAPVRIVAAASVVTPNRPPFDPVYGPALRNTWDWLTTLTDTNGVIDVGIAAGRLDAPPTGTLAPHLDAPLLLASHLDNFVQTEPEPTHQSPPALWLHGTADTDTDIQIVWRADLTPDTLTSAANDTDDLAAVTACLAIRPPHPDEAMPVPIAAARRWLTQTAPTGVADTDTTIPDEEDPTPGQTRPFIRWAPAASETRVVTDAKLQPGDLIVVPATYGGISQGTWSPTTPDPADDIADHLDTTTGGPVAVRVLPEHYPNPPIPTPLDSDAGIDHLAQVLDWYHTQPDPDPDTPLARLLAIEPSPDVVTYPIGRGQLRLLLRRPGQPSAEVPMDGSDEVNSLTGRAVPLDEHLEGVGEIAARFARSCGLDTALVDDLALAGRLHDLGKLDPRFQILLHDGDVLAAAIATRPLAKSATRQHGRARGLLADHDRYPTGARHELLTLAITDQHPELICAANDPELVEHLIAGHHGYCRPFAPPQHDPHSVAVNGQVGDVPIATTSAVPARIAGTATSDRFWRLVRRYGWYGLAWLEAVFRLADHHRSHLEQQQHPATTHAVAI